MEKRFYLTLAAYNQWANHRAMGWLENISDDQWNKAVVSSFGSLGQTALHMASAEKIWTDFWANDPAPVYLSAVFKGSKEELMGIWWESSMKLHRFIETYPEEKYLDPITFVYPNGRKGQMPFWQTVPHIMNHSSYHRGQLVTLLRQTGFTGLSSIDLATYYLLNSVQT
jgi:uncharacterized damage-inducible protein DinB